VHDQRLEALALGLHQAQPPQPLGRDAAGGGLALADLVAVDNQHVGPRTGQLAGDGKPREARAADQDVVRAVELSPLCATLRCTGWHAGQRIQNGPAIMRVRVRD
jgi:hypothetical protein